jgi:hypothetical protein
MVSMQGADLEVYGFQPNVMYRGKKFCDVAGTLAEEDNVIIIGMQVCGRMMARWGCCA